MKTRWVPLWAYRYFVKEPPKEIGRWAGPLHEWCHLCQRSHPYPAKDYCPARGR